MRSKTHTANLLAFWVISVLPFLCSSPASAQRITGSIVGIVTDTTGAVVPEAKVTLLSLDTGREMGTTSAPDGTYTFAQLLPGRYSVRVERQGFERKIVTDIKLSADQTARVDLTLSVGAVTTTVEVSAGGAALLQTQTSELAQVVENRKIRELPLNGRNFVQLGATTAGVIGGDQLISNVENWSGRSGISLWIGGQREINAGYIVDGIETRNDRFGAAGVRPAIDMIEEFKVDRNSQGSEFGNDSTAVVQVTTKSGTNEFHGTAWEFLRNDKLDARNFFDRQKLPLRFNQFGGAVGGPILKNKLFFFGGYEGFRERRGNTLKGLFPSKAQLQGNLADDSAGTGVFPTNSPFCQSNPGSKKCKNIVDPFTGQPFPGNVIPSGGFSNFGKAAALFFPDTNNLSELPLFNRIIGPSTVHDFSQFLVRLDQNLSSKDTIFYRYIWYDSPQVTPGLTFLGGKSQPEKAQNFVLGWTRSIKPNLVSSFHGGYNRTSEFFQPEGGGPNAKDFSKDVFGLKNTTTNPLDFGIPTVGIVGFSGIGAVGLVIGEIQQAFEFTDNLNYTRGKHNIGFGGQFRRFRYFSFTDSPGHPSLTFTGQFTGSSVGDLLLGIPVSAQEGLGDSSQNIRVSFLSGYVSDSYRVRPNLTLNFGLRYEYRTPPTEINNRQAVFDIPQRKFLLACKDIRCSIIKAQYNNFSPRFGFAYMPFGSNRTVIRGGLGMSWAFQEANEYQFLVLTPPFRSALALVSSGTTPTLFADTVFPPVDISAQGNSFPFSRDPNERRPYVMQWNLAVQREFRSNWALEFSYEGNSSVRNGTYGQINAARVDPTGTIPFVQRVPIPGLTGLLIATTNGHGSYHAGAISVKKRFSEGMSFLANYTYGRSIDDSSSELNFTYRPEFGRRDMRGPSDFDIHHRLVMSYVYELPVGKGKRFLDKGGVTDAVLGGWEVTGITTFMTGPPGVVHVPGDWALRGPLAFTRPDCVSNPNQSSIRDKVRSNGLLYFDPTGFRLPAPFTLGNCGRNVLRSAGINNWDMSFDKTFHVTEALSLQGRFEFFNIWNNAQWMPFVGGGALTFGQPGFGNPTFGRVTSARRPREIQLGLKVIF